MQRDSPVPIFQAEQGSLIYYMQERKWVVKWVIKVKSTSILNELTCFLLVEAMGIEPALFPHTYIGRLKIRRNQATFYDMRSLPMPAIAHTCA